MTTLYHPLPRHNKMKWLLTDGRIVEEPDLEQSDSGRRVRVRGSSKSVYMKELDDLIYRSVTQFAAKAGAQVWMRVQNDDPIIELDNELGTASRIDKPHFVSPEDDSYGGRSSSLVWTFRHETLPLAARITLDMMEPRRRYNRQDATQQATVSVTYPSTHPSDGFDRAWVPDADDVNDFQFAIHGDSSNEFAQQRQNFVDWLRETGGSWKEFLGTTTWNNEREAAGGIARIVRIIESLDEVSIPDLRDPANPQWLPLKLHSTTYSRDFTQSLVDFINGQPLVEQIQEHWNAMTSLMRRAGLVTGDLEESDFHAMLQGELDRVGIEVNPVSAPNEEGGRDVPHTVGFNLATGTITVTCSVRDTHPNDVATEYEVARIKAEVQGELDSFLGYQADFLNSRHDDRHGRTVTQRTVEIDEDDLDQLLDLT